MTTDLRKDIKITVYVLIFCFVIATKCPELYTVSCMYTQCGIHEILKVIDMP